MLLATGFGSGPGWTWEGGRRPALLRLGSGDDGIVMWCRCLWCHGVAGESLDAAVVRGVAWHMYTHAYILTQTNPPTRAYAQQVLPLLLLPSSSTMADMTHPAANDDELVDYDEENEQEEAGKVCVHWTNEWTDDSRPTPPSSFHVMAALTPFTPPIH